MMRAGAILALFIILVGQGAASYANHHDSAGLLLWQVTLGLDENGTESYSIPQVGAGNLSQIDYRATGLTGNNTVSITLSDPDIVLDSYNVTAGNASRPSVLGYITDRVDFDIVNGTANATIKLNMFLKQ